MTAPRGIRNNNPGNLRHGQPWLGLADEQSDKDFCTFKEMRYGIRALIKLLLTYRTKYSLITVRGVINRWAPPSENDTSAYITAVARALNVGPDDELPLTRDTYLALAKAIAAHENGAADASRIPYNAWMEGLNLAFDVQTSPTVPTFPPAPAEPAKPPKEPIMGIPVALITAAAQALFPVVADMFKKHGGDTAERNAAIIEKAGPILVEAAKVATGEASIDGAVSAVLGSKEGQQAFRKQVEIQWFEIVEAGGGGIAGARQFNLAAAGTPFWMMPAFWVTALLLPLVYYTTYAVLSGAVDKGFSGELKAAIASAIISGVLGGVVGFWLGSSFTTSRSRGLGATPTQEP